MGAPVGWIAALAGMVAVRVALPLVVREQGGEALPLLPEDDGVLLSGDANGYFEAVGNLINSSERVLAPRWPLFAVGLLIVWGASAALAKVRPAWRWVSLVLAALAASAVLAYVVADVDPPGAPVIGWPLLWMISLLGFVDWRELRIDYAFDYALGLSLAANAVTTVGTAYVGYFASGRRSIGLLAAALYASWPAWVGLVAGEQAWENGQWDVDVGLHLYTEPASTALVVGGVALLLKPDLGATRAAGAGLLLGYSAVVKLTNGLLAAVLLPLLAARSGVRVAVSYTLACLVFLPIILVYWPKGYVQIYDGGVAPVPTPWSIDHVALTWENSTIFTPGMLVLLCVPAAAGVAFLRGAYARLAVLLPVGINAGVYSLYYATYQHPRFLYVALPFVFVLVSAGVISGSTYAWSRGASLADTVGRSSQSG